MDITHRPVCHLKHEASGTEFCPRLHLELTQLGPRKRASLSLPIEPNILGSS
jgi:hypothetical protein